MKLMLIDGNSIVNRAYYGIRLLSARDGTPTNAVYGFLTMLRRMLEDEKPDGLCVAFDLKAPTFRHLQYDGYKAQRKAMPEELAVQIPILKQVLDAMNITRCEAEGWEADDIIGTLSRKAEKQGWQSVIVTGDKDSFQLICPSTAVRYVKTRMGQTETKLFNEAAFIEEYGFEPVHMIDLKALMGDASDNIPGVAGVGEKTAGDLIRRFSSVDKIYGQLPQLDIKPAVAKKLADGKASAEMSYDLARIRCDAPVEFAPELASVRAVDNDKLYELFKKLEFSKLIEQFGLHAPGEAEPEMFTGECTSIEVITPQQAREMLAALESAPLVCVRTAGELDTVVAETDDCAYILRRSTLTDFSGVMARLFGGAVKKAGHNIKDTMRLLLSMGLPVEGWVFDTALAAYLISSTDSAYPLSGLTERYLGFSLKTADESGQLSLLDGGEDMLRLSVEAAAIAALKEYFEPELDKLGLSKLLYEIELPLCPVLARMEAAGFMTDKAALHDFGEKLSAQIKILEADIFETAGHEFNINSPKQLGTVLFEELMLPAPKKTKTGYSTNADVLDKLRGKHPLIGKILEYRQLAKLRSTYTDGLQKVICEDGRIRTSFQMTVTATGRLSSTEPNLQNIPVRTELGGEIRKMFIAKDGCVLVDADYSQVELRLLACISQDETMKNAFLSGEDIHTVTASQVFGVPLESVLPVQRSRAKAVNFGIVYGISAFSLAQDIGVSVAEAKEYMDRYLDNFHGVRRYMHEVVEKAKADGFVTTLYGRRRELPELKSSNFNLRAFGERVALNMPIQGTAADIMKLAMIRADARLRAEKLNARLLLQVHDELIAECPEEEQQQVMLILREEMENAAQLDVPLTVGVGSGKSWYEAK